LRVALFVAIVAESLTFLICLSTNSQPLTCKQTLPLRAGQAASDGSPIPDHR
jgi:hypothetical protein